MRHGWRSWQRTGSYVRHSFPPEPIRQLRDLTRARQVSIRDRTRQSQRLEKFLESSGIKLSSVASELMRASSRAILDALVAGERDPAVLADLSRGQLRCRIPKLLEALRGRLTEHHAFMARQHLAQIDAHQAMIDDLTSRIEQQIEPFRPAREALITIPGVSTSAADVIIAGTGADMTVFSSAAHLVPWAGVCPGQNESAGRVKSAHTRPGNAYLKAVLGIAAMSVTRSKNTYLAARYRRIATRRGPIHAVVAIAHAILTAIWNMLRNGEVYTEPGADYYTRNDPQTRFARPG